MQYATSVMTDPAAGQHSARARETSTRPATNGTLPAVSFLKPERRRRAPRLFNAGCIRVLREHMPIDEVPEQPPDLWKSTAFVVTFDEGGGY